MLEEKLILYLKSASIYSYFPISFHILYFISDKE